MDLAYRSEASEPSAYDLIFLCNFLTRPTMPTQFEADFTGLHAR